MAIVQVSRITNRKGLQENLPQLAGAELGWAVDTRQLYIGNGTLEEGAPFIGNTEILTEISNITELSSYTYQDSVVGYTAQTGATPSDPVIRTVQKKLDDFADIRDFGAVGDGVTDDTDAINRALYQLYCRETNTEIRRSLFFPAGTYRVIQTIVIPTYAKLVGEGADCTIIQMDTSADLSSLNEYVARYGDSLQQTGVNIGTNGATPPQNIEISSMSFKTLEDNTVFLVDQASQCWFHSVNFTGPLSQADIITAGLSPVAGVNAVSFNGTLTLPCTNITFDCCAFENASYGIRTSTYAQGITVSNSKFDTLYKGVSLTTYPTGFRVLHNIFDNIYSIGVEYSTNFCASAFNAFYNVGYYLTNSSPQTPVVALDNDTSVSANDLFERSDSDAYLWPRVVITTSVTTSGGTGTQMGRLFQGNGRTFTLEDNQSSTQLVTAISNNWVKAFKMFYTISRTTAVRNGILTVVSGPGDSTGAMAYTDDYTENDLTGITLTVEESGSSVQVRYTSTSTGDAGTLTYSITHLA